MKRTLPPLNALRAFEAAGRCGSFKGAAAELHVTQGAVSQQVRMLEEWLGAPVFERHNRRIELTPAARAYLAHIGPAFEQLSQASSTYGTSPARSRMLSVNAPSTFTLRWLVPRLEAFRSQHADVEVRVETSNAPLESLTDRFDVIIRGGPDTYYGYTMQYFLSEERVPVCSPALLQRQPLRMIEDIQQHTLLHTSSLPRVWPDWLAQAKGGALEAAATITFDHFYLTIQAAIEGIGIAMGPTALVADDLAAGRLVAPFAEPRLPSRSYFTYVPAERHTDDIVVQFRAWLSSEAAGSNLAFNESHGGGTTSEMGR
ncbi:transcriptional regulator GcvA [Schauerella aestuarii]|uniref:transcriptional regulator GcvA n=1 Tax=Schauerella aestuarii TaxID=2511204 RepID=UPI001368C0AB|nr:transcriptional regulator GcvA [Achromobacter aestuarii]MYZ43332.1 transcriptional regulator GcvA [Achromobacter aestuarii]